MTPTTEATFYIQIRSVPISVAVPIHTMIVVSMPHTDANSAVMVTAMIADADADSPYPNGDSRGVRGRHRHRQSQAESCERSE